MLVRRPHKRFTRYTGFQQLLVSRASSLFFSSVFLSCNTPEMQYAARTALRSVLGPSLHSSKLALAPTVPFHGLHRQQRAEQNQQERRVATAALPLASLAMTPLLGGLVLGASTVSTLFLTGRVLGISGAVKGIVSGDRALWRPAFLLGLLLPVPLLANILPQAVSALPGTLSIERALLSGLLVGIGAALGNGCTSGHGICGNARLSPRSMLFTLAFMAAGAISVRAFDSVTALGLTPPSGIALATPEQLTLVTALVAGCLGLVGVSAVLSKALRREPNKPSLAIQSANIVATAGTAAVFAAGLMLSGMCNPQKVVGFLAVGTPFWDPSLMLVMGGALAVAILPYQWVLKQLHLTTNTTTNANCPPVCTPVLADTYNLPSNSARVDAKLLLGGALFGTGWGLSGMCPGPALIGAVAPTAGVGVWAYVAAMVVGMIAEPQVATLLTRILAGSQQTISPPMKG